MSCSVIELERLKLNLKLVRIIAVNFKKHDVSLILFTFTTIHGNANKVEQ